MEASHFFSTQTFQHLEFFPLDTSLPIWLLFPPACHAHHFPPARLRECCHLLAENAFRYSSFSLLKTANYRDNSFPFQINCQILLCDYQCTRFYGVHKGNIKFDDYFPSV